jgi:hypothetical protein
MAQLHDGGKHDDSCNEQRESAQQQHECQAAKADSIAYNLKIGDRPNRLTTI